MNNNDDSTSLHVDSYQLENLNEFSKVMPSTKMCEELIYFIISCRFDTDMLGLAG